MAPRLQSTDKIQEVNFQDAMRTIRAGLPLDKLSVEKCKAYLRHHCLQVSGNKASLIERISEHLELKSLERVHSTPSSFTILVNAQEELCVGDVIMFEEELKEKTSPRRAVYKGKRRVAARVMAVSALKYHLDCEWSDGVDPLSPGSSLVLRRKAKQELTIQRQHWDDEADRRRRIEVHRQGLTSSDTPARDRAVEAPEIVLGIVQTPVEDRAQDASGAKLPNISTPTSMNPPTPSSNESPKDTPEEGKETDAIGDQARELKEQSTRKSFNRPPSVTFYRDQTPPIAKSYPLYESDPEEVSEGRYAPSVPLVYDFSHRTGKKKKKTYKKSASKKNTTAEDNEQEKPESDNAQEKPESASKKNKAAENNAQEKASKKKKTTTEDNPQEKPAAEADQARKTTAFEEPTPASKSKKRSHVDINVQRSESPQRTTDGRCFEPLRESSMDACRLTNSDSKNIDDGEKDKRKIGREHVEEKSKQTDSVRDMGPSNEKEPKKRQSKRKDKSREREQEEKTEREDRDENLESDKEPRKKKSKTKNRDPEQGRSDDLMTSIEQCGKAENKKSGCKNKKRDGGLDIEPEQNNYAKSKKREQQLPESHEPEIMKPQVKVAEEPKLESDREQRDGSKHIKKTGKSRGRSEKAKDLWNPQLHSWCEACKQRAGSKKCVERKCKRCCNAGKKCAFHYI